MSPSDSRIPRRPADPDQYWTWLAQALDTLEQDLAWGREPDRRVHWSHPDDQWKETAEAQATERDHRPATLALLAVLLRQGAATPADGPPEAAHYAAIRLRFAARQARLLGTPPAPGQPSPIAPPPDAARVVILWLTGPVYDRSVMRLP